MERRIGGLHTEVEGICNEIREEIGVRAEMCEKIGEFSERLTRIDALIETHLVSASNPQDPTGP